MATVSDAYSIVSGKEAVKAGANVVEITAKTLAPSNLIQAGNTIVGIADNPNQGIVSVGLSFIPIKGSYDAWMKSWGRSCGKPTVTWNY